MSVTKLSPFSGEKSNVAPPSENVHVPAADASAGSRSRRREVAEWGMDTADGNDCKNSGETI